MKRQLLWTRLYHPSWYFLLGSTWILHIIIVATLLIGIQQIWAGSVQLGVAMLIASAVPTSMGMILTEWQHRTIARRINEHQGAKVPEIDAASRLRMSLVLPVAFVMMCYAMLAAEFSRSVTWSGITYRIIDGKDLLMVKYMPLADVRSRQQRRSAAEQGISCLS